MQVTETVSDGLKRGYKVVLPASDLAERLNGQLVEMKDKVQIKGFRPGKVPMAHLRRLYGRNIMAEVIQNAVNEANQKIVADNSLRLAAEPRVAFPEDQAEVERALEAEGDLSFNVDLEVLPKFDIGSFDDVALERLVSPISEEEVETTLNNLAEQNRPYVAKEGDEPSAEKGDKATIDFLGEIDGVAFDGGAGTDTDLVIGSNSFIPGFEDQLIGMKPGEQRKIEVTFPENYSAANLAGKAATFTVTLKVLAAPGAVAIDDEFAKGLRFDSLDKLKEMIRSNIEREFTRASREKLKRALLDVLDKRYSFVLPASLVDQEFTSIWNQVEAEQKQTGRGFADEGTTEEAARADYRQIAERRVRLGLLLAEVGEKAGVKVTDDEISAALVERVRQFPGQEQAVWDYYRKNEQAMATVRAPLYEEKVVDHILAQAKITDRTVSKEELFKPDEAETPAGEPAVAEVAELAGPASA